MKKTFQHIEQELHCYHQTKREIEHLRADIINATSNRDGGGGGNRVGSVVESKVTRLLTSKRIEYMQEIIEAIEHVYSTLPDDKKRFIDLRYFTRLKLLTMEGVAMECNISRVTAFRWRDEIITAIASRLGWV
jgi:RinA family phage transcriptional activator